MGNDESKQQEALKNDHRKRERGITFTFAFAFAAVLIALVSLLVSLR